MTPSRGLPAGLPQLVHDKFLRAKTAGDLSFFPTQVALLRVHGVPFQLRFAPALAKKPESGEDRANNDTKDAKQKNPPSKPFDPFEDPPQGLLVVPRIGEPDAKDGTDVKEDGQPTHRLVLNKFAISQDHSILATAGFRPQTHLLDESDLATAYACIDAYHRAGEALFVFYNSGRHSGASQPHRHLQLLPVARMREGLGEKGTDTNTDRESEWDVLVDRIIVDGKGGGELPFYVAAARLPEESSPSPASLHTTYLALYRQACAAAQGTAAVLAVAAATDAAVDDTAAEERGEVPARISYNLALTRRTMAIIPRTAEGSAVTSDGSSLSLNGTVLAGTALVKNEAEWDALRRDPARLGDVLAHIGVPVRRAAVL
ncbi:bifunctional AP-4-A phosphorylase/ADP sulfurylase [Sporothrix curviconia]|uniref:Bifunctional AP-4-A phosphorylase/ADP sulfurylase n=1 Tax=Sporothrix curviconia TaxID=1260050 RepID=A0ABP0BEI6_9PEZI